jgi:hypothetical protein
MVATAALVVAVATAVSRLGPVAGGLVAGLPIGLGPGFFFLIDANSTAFLQQTAVHSLLALSATQVFLTSYMATARLGSPLVSLGLAVGIWWTAVWALKGVPATAAAATMSFILVTVLTRLIGRKLLIPSTRPARREGFLMLLVRAFAAGLLVALVTAFSATLGAPLSGVLLAFPIGYALISLTIHEQFGAPTVIGVVYSALFGTISLATFCVAFVYALHVFAPLLAIVISLFVSFGATAGMMVIARRKRPLRN